MTKERTTEKLKVFDLHLYSGLSPEKRTTVMTEDLSGIVIEAGDRRLEERINPRRFKIREGQILDSVTGSLVTEEFSTKDEFASRETTGALDFYRKLYEGEPGTVVIQTSPSGGKYNYNESRINVGLRVSEDEIEFYGIPSHKKPEELFYYTVKLTEWNTDPFLPEEPEDLRQTSTRIIVPPEVNPWMFLDEVAPLDSEAWQSILSGLPWEIKRKAEADAASIAAEMSHRLKTAKNDFERVEIGAWGERAMSQKGWQLNPLACPGLFNSQLTSESNMLTGYGIKKDVFGSVRMTKWEYHVGTCQNPECKAKGVEVGPCQICKKCEKVL